MDVLLAQALPHLGVEGGRVGPQLEHIPQHGGLIAAVAVGEHPDGRPHGLGVGVVGVVQNGDVLPPLHQVHAHAGGDKAGDPLLDLAGGEAEVLPHRRGDEGGVDHVLPQGGDLHLPVHGRGGEVAVDVTHPIPAGDLSPVLRPLAPAAEDGLYRGVPPEGDQQPVVGVEDEQAVLLPDVGQQLALGLEDVLPAAQLLNVGVADVGDDPHFGPDDVP